MTENKRYFFKKIFSFLNYIIGIMIFTFFIFFLYNLYFLNINEMKINLTFTFFSVLIFIINYNIYENDFN